MARISTYDKDVSLSGKDKVVGSNYVSTINQVDQYVTNNFTLKDLAEYFTGQIIIDPVNLPLKSNGGLVYETTLDTNFLAVDLSATNITGQLANSDLVNSYITINGTNVQLGGSISIPIGDITSVIAGTYLNGGGTIDDVTLNHDLTSRTDTTTSSTITSTFTAITSITSNATGHITSEETTTYTLPTDIYVNSAAVTGTTTKTITLGRTGALSDLTANFTDNDTIPNDATITLSAGTYISGGGDFTTDQSANETIAFNHDNTTRTDTTSAVGPNHGADFTVIDTLTSNATGHITAANVKTVTLPNGANDNTITLSAGTYLSGGGDFTVDQSFDETLTINHDSTTRSDTTSNDSNNAASDTFTAIDSVSTNATGHVTAVNLKTIQFPSDANTDVDVNVSNLETRLGQIGNTSIGSSGSTITIPNLTVTGTQTINNVEVISTSSGIVFEGTSNDANETTLNVINPTADRAINLPNKSGTVALLDDIPTVNDGTLTVQGSSGLTGSGTFTANDADSPTITISHADTSSQASVNNSGNTFIQDITLDTYGHITGITSGTATDNDTITQIREDNGSYRTGSITLQSGTNVTITEPSTGVFNFAATNTNDIDYINSASFNTGNGILTLSGVGNAGASVDLDGRYLTSYSETDTLATVTARGASTSTDTTFNSNLAVTGTSHWFTVQSNAAGTSPGISQGIAMAWNRSNGSRESEIIFHPGNTTHADGELYIRSYNGSTFQTVVEFQGTGNTIFSGNINAESTSSSYIRKAYDSSRYAQLESNSSGGVLNLTHTSSTRVLLRSYGDCYFVNPGNIGIGETNPLSDLTVRSDSSGGRGGEISIVNYAASAVGNEAALNFGLENSTYQADTGNAQIKARVNNGSSAATDMIFSLWNGSAFGEKMRITSDGMIGIGMTPSTVASSTYMLQMYNSGSQCFLSIGNGTSGNGPTNGLIIGNDAGNAYVLNREATPLKFYTNDIQRMLITSGGNIGINDAGPTQRLQVGGAVAAGARSTTGSPNTSGVTTQLAFEARSTSAGNDPSIAFHKESVYTMYFQSQNSGRGLRIYSPTSETTANLYVQGDVIAFSSSDKKLKNNIKRISNPLQKINKISGNSFIWNEEKQDVYKGKDYGVIAQEIELILPELVETREDGYKAVKYDKIVPLLIEAVKELSNKVKALENGITK